MGIVGKLNVLHRKEVSAAPRGGMALSRRVYFCCLRSSLITKKWSEKLTAAINVSSSDVGRSSRIRSSRLTRKSERMEAKVCFPPQQCTRRTFPGGRKAYFRTSLSLRKPSKIKYRKHLVTRSCLYSYSRSHSRPYKNSGHWNIVLFIVLRASWCYIGPSQ